MASQSNSNSFKGQISFDALLGFIIFIFIVGQVLAIFDVLIMDQQELALEVQAIHHVNGVADYFTAVKILSAPNAYATFQSQTPKGFRPIYGADVSDEEYYVPPEGGEGVADCRYYLSPTYDEATLEVQRVRPDFASLPTIFKTATQVCLEPPCSDSVDPDEEVGSCGQVYSCFSDQIDAHVIECGFEFRAECNDGSLNENESNFNCPSDGEWPVGECGDGVCDTVECGLCYDDCGSCTV